jgi:hypothetical protein
MFLDENLKVINSLSVFWRSKGVTNNGGCNLESLHNFEEKYKILITGTLKTYFLLLNGMQENMQDDEFFSFWPIEEVSSLLEYDSSLYSENINFTIGTFVFADHLMNSSLYGFKKNHENDFCIYLLGGKNPILISKSFEDFLKKYMSNWREIV